MYKSLISLIAVVVFTGHVSANHYCQTDSDCSDLGELKCIKSLCKWGMCACPRGTISRFLGSEMKFKCVAQKKIGETCSTDGDNGVCGAPNSFCNDKQKCECDDTYVSRFNGEYCMKATNVYPSEMISGDARTCQASSSRLQQGGFYPHTILAYNPMICGCPQGSKTTTNNMYDQYFQGKKVPFCQPLKIGDTCITDDDCKNINGGVCTSNKCACDKSDEVADDEGYKCGKALAFGNNCTGILAAGKVCEGSKGLTCAVDYCYEGKLSNTYATCVCHYFYSKSGSTCTKRKIGDACDGDINCKGINANAVCVEGTCQSGAMKQVISLMLLVVCVMSIFG